MSLTLKMDSTHTAVPINRYDVINEATTMLLALLKPESHDNAKQAYAALLANQTKLTNERNALERAQKSVSEAKANVKKARSLGTKLLPTAVAMGEILDIISIANFTPKDESWRESVEAVAARYEAQGKGGKFIAEGMRRVLSKIRTGDANLERASAELDLASQAFSGTYKHLSNAVSFARVVLLNLGVAVPTSSKTAGKKRKVAAPVAHKQETAPASNVALTPAA